MSLLWKILKIFLESKTAAKPNPWIPGTFLVLIFSQQAKYWQRKIILIEINGKVIRFTPTKDNWDCIFIHLDNKYPPLNSAFTSPKHYYGTISAQRHFIDHNTYDYKKTLRSPLLKDVKPNEGHYHGSCEQHRKESSRT